MAVFNSGQRIMPVYQVDEAGTTLPSRASEDTLAAVLDAVEARTTPADTQPVSVADLPLPAGAATEATLAGRLTDAQLRASPVQVNQRDYATFVATAPAVSLAAGKSLLSLLNASSGVIRVRRVYLVNVQTGAVTGVAAEFQLRRFTGHNAGSVLAPEAHDDADALDAGVTARTGATLSGEAGTYLGRQLWSSDDWGPGTLDTESSDHAAQTLSPAWRFDAPLRPITLRTGQGLTVRCHAGAAGTFDVSLVFTVD